MHNAYETDQDVKAFIALVKSHGGHWKPPVARGGVTTQAELIEKAIPATTEQIKAELMAMLKELESGAARPEGTD